MQQPTDTATIYCLKDNLSVPGDEIIAHYNQMHAMIKKKNIVNCYCALLSVTSFLTKLQLLSNLDWCIMLLLL